MHPSLVSFVATAASNAGAHVSMAGVLGRLVVSLLVVLGILWALAQLVRRRGLPGILRGGGLRGGGTGAKVASRAQTRDRQRPIEVISRQTLGKGQALLTVRVEGMVMLLGVTAHTISRLCDLGPEPLVAGEVPAATAGGDVAAATSGVGSSGRARSSRVEHLRELTVRR